MSSRIPQQKKKTDVEWKREKECSPGTAQERKRQWQCQRQVSFSGWPHVTGSAGYIRRGEMIGHYGSLPFAVSREGQGNKRVGVNFRLPFESFHRCIFMLLGWWFVYSLIKETGSAGLLDLGSFLEFFTRELVSLFVKLKITICYKTSGTGSENSLSRENDFLNTLLFVWLKTSLVT